MNSQSKLNSKLWHVSDISLGVLGLLMPGMIWLGGLSIFDIPLQPSVSDYYHTPIGPFHVAALLAFAAYFAVRPWATRHGRIIGVLIGLFSAIAAIVPVPQCHETGGMIARAQDLSGLVHLTFAFLLLCTFAYLTLFCFGKPIGTGNPADGNRRNLHRLLGVIMLVCSVLIGKIGLSGDTCHSAVTANSDVFWLEAAALSAFWLSWIIENLDVRRR